LSAADKLWHVIREATLYFLLGIGLCALHFAVFGRTTEFAARWDGGCTGWTRWLAVENLVGALMTWWAYCAIGIGVGRLHPVVDWVPESRLTVRLTCAFILLCGLTHLFGAYTNLNPVYAFATHFQSFAATVSDVASVFVLAGLIRVFTQVSAARARAEARLAELEAKQR